MVMYMAGMLQHTVGGAICETDVKLNQIIESVLLPGVLLAGHIFNIMQTTSRQE